MFLTLRPVSITSSIGVRAQGVLSMATQFFQAIEKSFGQQPSATNEKKIFVRHLLNKNEIHSVQMKYRKSVFLLIIVWGESDEVILNETLSM